MVRVRVRVRVGARVRVRVRVKVRVRVRVRVRVKVRVRVRVRVMPRRARSGAPPNYMWLQPTPHAHAGTASTIHGCSVAPSGDLTVVSEPLGDTYVHGAVPV